VAVRSSAANPPPPVNIPKLVTDPLASLACHPVNVSMAGHEVVIPALSAHEWLSVLMGEDFTTDAVFPDLCEDPDVVEDALMDGLVTVEEVAQLALDCISTAGGRPWWVVLRLVKTVQGSWDAVGGEFVLRQVPTGSMSLAAWCDVATLILIRALGENDKVNSFLMQLDMPPPGQEVELEPMDANQFLSMM